MRWDRSGVGVRLRRGVAAQALFEVATLPATVITVVVMALGAQRYGVRPGDWWYVSVTGMLFSPVFFSLIDAVSGEAEPFPPLGGKQWLATTVAARTVAFGGPIALDVGALRVGFGLGCLCAVVYAAVVRGWIALAARSRGSRPISPRRSRCPRR